MTAPGLSLQERLGRIEELVVGGTGVEAGSEGEERGLRDTLGKIQELVTGGTEVQPRGPVKGPIEAALAPLTQVQRGGQTGREAEGSE